jgi:FkbM family methyltransferase
MFNILEVLPPFGKIQVIDVGAMDVGADVYDPLIKAGVAEVLGFECIRSECDRLNAMAREARSYLPYAIGDGSERDFHECNFPMTSSLLEPNSELLDRFHNLENLVRVVKKHRLATRRLDDISQISGADFLKLDVQGGELDVLNGAGRVLEDVLVVHTEVEFVELYKGQPLFAEIDQKLRKSGFVFHKFSGIEGRAFKPLVVKNDINASLSQMLWADAVYVKDFMALDRLSAEKLLRLAVILHEVYGSSDLSLQALLAHDRQSSSGVSRAYLNRLNVRG